MSLPDNARDTETIRVRGASMFLDGAKIEATSKDGWLYLTVEADESIIAYAVTVNGKDLPYQPGEKTP